MSTSLTIHTQESFLIIKTTKQSRLIRNQVILRFPPCTPTTDLSRTRPKFSVPCPRRHSLWYPMVDRQKRNTSRTALPASKYLSRWVRSQHDISETVPVSDLLRIPCDIKCRVYLQSNRSSVDIYRPLVAITKNHDILSLTKSLVLLTMITSTLKNISLCSKLKNLLD